MRAALIIACLAALSGCDAPSQTQSQTDVWTLYRDSEITPNMRLHVATFDSAERAFGGGASYNQQSCMETADLYAANDPAHKNWWCEPGRFRERR